MEKEMVQKLEWLEAQKIEISVDLFVAAKQQLQFLGVVEQNPWLYHGPRLERAIYRYNAYWLPLLAKYSESSLICEGPLVPPVDCEWVWHCHRLNPVRYKSDCEQFYGRVLDNSGIVSSTNGSFKLQSENLWKKLYPMEPYDLDMDEAISEPEDTSVLEKCTTYDFVSAVKRQSSFYYEVSKAHVDSDIMIQEAVGKYKALLYLIKRNHEKSIKLISVPTYDIDLIWHTHQLYPSSYYKDMEKIFGNILQHDDDTDSDESKGKKLDIVFSATTAQWEETFGRSYWRAKVETTTDMLAVEKSGGAARCFFVAAEKSDGAARCAFVAAEKCGAGARCRAKVAEKHGGDDRCYAKIAEKHDVGARCCAKVAEKLDVGARCCAKVDEKHYVGARYLAVTIEKKSARCFVVAAENNSGCGNMMKDNANENASLAKALNGAVAA